MQFRTDFQIEGDPRKEYCYRTYFYSIYIDELRNGRFSATIPKLPHISIEAGTVDEAKIRAEAAILSFVKNTGQYRN
jgi:predicted RNase H-like HicB family nuclease